MIKILVVEDDDTLNMSVCKHLSMRGYLAKGCLDALSAIDLMATEHYDLIISDIMMPKMDGFEFARHIREMDRNIPILFMTARDDFTSKEKGYKIGIDDYLVKPFDLEELILRISALLRRAQIVASKKLSVGNLTLDEDAFTAEVDGEPVVLTLREFQILYAAKRSVVVYALFILINCVSLGILKQPFVAIGCGFVAVLPIVKFLFSKNGLVENHLHDEAQEMHREETLYEGDDDEAEANVTT